MPNAIMIALGKVKPKKDKEDKGLASAMEDEEEDKESSHDIEVDEHEMEAAKEAFNASTPEEYAKALKAFVQLCYSNHEEDEEY